MPGPGLLLSESAGSAGRGRLEVSYGKSKAKRVRDRSGHKLIPYSPFSVLSVSGITLLSFLPFPWDLLSNYALLSHRSNEANSKWLDAHYDPMANIHTFSSCLGESPDLGMSRRMGGSGNGEGFGILMHDPLVFSSSGRFARRRGVQGRRSES